MRKHYVSDWTDAFDNKRECIPAILFLYFSCLAPVVSFGTIASQVTEGSIGVVEYLIGSGGAGMVSSMTVSTPSFFFKIILTHLVKFFIYFYSSSYCYYCYYYYF